MSTPTVSPTITLTSTQPIEEDVRLEGEPLLALADLVREYLQWRIEQQEERRQAERA